MDLSRKLHIGLCIVLVCSSAAVGCSFGLRSGKKTDWIIEGLYRSLKLPEDATDEQIIERLYMPVLEIGGVKLADPIAACSLIERERIYAAIPNLLKMVNDTDDAKLQEYLFLRVPCPLILQESPLLHQSNHNSSLLIIDSAEKPYFPLKNL